MIKRFLRSAVLSSVLAFCSCDTVPQNNFTKIDAGTYSGLVNCEGEEFPKTVEIHGSGRPLYDGQIARPGLEIKTSPLEFKAAQILGHEVIQLDVAPMEPFETSCVVDNISQSTGNLNGPSAEIHVAHNFRKGYLAGRIDEHFIQNGEHNVLEYGLDFVELDFATTSGIITPTSGNCSGTLYKQN